VASLGLGAAYIYFDGNDNIWKPLTALFVKRDHESVDSA
jgi:hypothetical protein